MALRRVKTYTAQTGYVYEYYFVGQRNSDRDGQPATEYIFDVISDRRARYSVSILLLQEAGHAWAGTHGRALGAPELYAAAKLRLQQGFDDISDMLTDGRSLTVDAGNIEDLLAPLGLQ